MSDQKDEQVLENYLKGDTDLSKRYRAESTEEPPAHLDKNIVTAAKKAVTDKKAGSGPFSKRWYMPLSAAAIVVISFGIVFKIYDELSPGSEKQVEMGLKKPEILKDSRMDDEIGESASVIKGKEQFRNEAGNIDKESDRDAQILKKEVVPSSESALKDEPARSKSSTSDSYKQKIQTLPVEEEAEKILTPKSMRDLIERKKQSELAPAALTPQEWFELINKLWHEGKKEGARLELNNFLEAYPDYPKEQLQFQIPEEMDLSEINK